jgi:hypothetical protein
MGMITMTLATAISGATVPCVVPSVSVDHVEPRWTLLSDLFQPARPTIVLSGGFYDSEPIFEAAMRLAVITSTEHRYDL